MRHAYVLIIIGLLVIGCTTTPEQQSLLQNQVFSLRQVQKKQTQRQQAIQDKLTTLEKEIQELRTASGLVADDQTTAVLSSQAELSSRVESQQIKLATLTGNQENLERSFAELKQEGQQNSQDIEAMHKRLERLETNLHLLISQLGVDLEGSSAQGADQGESSRESEEKAAAQEITAEFLYDQALQAFNQRKYNQAIGLWADMIENFPEHDLAANAHFWQGEAYFQLQDYPQAVLHYNTVIESYPKSNKYPASLLKQGLSYYALDKNRAGRLRLEELIRKFPERAEAKRAKSFLDNR